MIIKPLGPTPPATQTMDGNKMHLIATNLHAKKAQSGGGWSTTSKRINDSTRANLPKSNLATKLYKAQC